MTESIDWNDGEDEPQQPRSGLWQRLRRTHSRTMGTDATCRPVSVLGTDEDHRGDDAKDCPACSAFRHRTEQVLGVRTVDNAIKAITLFWSGEAPIETLAEARAQLIEHYGSQIATLDAADLDARDTKGGEVQ